MKRSASAWGERRASATAVNEVLCLGNVSPALFPGALEHFPAGTLTRNY